MSHPLNDIENLSVGDILQLDLVLQSDKDCLEMQFAGQVASFCLSSNGNLIHIAFTSGQSFAYDELSWKDSRGQFIPYYRDWQISVGGAPAKVINGRKLPTLR